ncbi:family 16 glycosylhydrolase [bacterium]|nr:family 16 glycosylhydrolase [bacterium]
MTKPLLSCAALSLASACANSLPLSDPANTGDWTLVESVSDEFNGDSLNSSKWINLGENGDYHGQWKGRAPSQYNPANVSVEDGFLTITSKWDPDFKFSDTSLKGIRYGKSAPITTAAIITKAKFKYGYLEMRCQAAAGPVSSSFWTTGKGGEIDVFEHFGENPANPDSACRYHTSFHDWRKGSPMFGKRIWDNDHRLGFKVAGDFHTYGLDWSPDRLSIYIDGRLIRSVSRFELGEKWIASNEQKIWIDSETFDWEIVPEQLTASQFEKEPKFIIDYCRVWQREKTVIDPKLPPNLFGNQNFEEGLKYWVGDGEITDDAHLGKSAAKLTKTGKIQQTVNVKPNTTYVLSAWAKLPGTNMKDAWTDATLNVASYGGPRRSTKFFKPDYHRKSLEFTTGPEATRATIFLTNHPKAHSVFVDHLELVESTALTK